MSVFPPSSHKFSIACGAGGAYVEVTDKVVFDEGAVTRSWGRQSSFSDAAPSTFSFTLDNRDGRFTPGTATPVAPVLTRLTEGMGVCWELNGQLRYGQIRSLPMVFPGVGVASSLRLRVTVSDSLAVAARTDIDPLSSAMVLGALPFLFWPLNDAVGSWTAADKSGSSVTPLTQFVPAFPAPIVGTFTFGADGPVQVADDQVRFDLPANASGGAPATGLSASGLFVEYASATDLGSWGAWFTRGSIQGALIITVSTSGSFPTFNFGVNASGFPVFNSVPAVGAPTLPVGEAHYLAVRTTAVFAGTWTITQTLYVDGVAQPSTGTVGTPFLAAGQTYQVVVQLQQAIADGAVSGFIAHLSHTQRPVNEALAGITTEGQRITAIASTVPTVTLATLPTDLDSAVIGNAASAGSALDAFNEIIRGEQGHIYTTVTGTLLAPVEKVTVRGRTRPETVTATFTTVDDIIGAPDIGRNITNTVSAVDVSGSDYKVRVTNDSLLPLVGSANASAQLALADPVDLRAWGEDRILRGINSGIDVFSIDVNARSTTTSRWADLMALIPGNRYRVAGLPVAQLGISSWDGWFLGAQEVHTQTDNLFTLYFERCLPRTGIFDTDRFMADGDLTLSANINASVTSITVATIGATFTIDPTDFPIDIEIGSEQLRATAATGATPQVLTVVRGVNGTTAATHTAGDLVDLAEDTLWAF